MICAREIFGFRTLCSFPEILRGLDGPRVDTHICTYTQQHTHGRMMEEGLERRKTENVRTEMGGGLINPPFGGILKTFDSSAHPLPTCLLFCEVV